MRLAIGIALCYGAAGLTHPITAVYGAILLSIVGLGLVADDVGNAIWRVTARSYWRRMSDRLFAGKQHASKSNRMSISQAAKLLRENSPFISSLERRRKRLSINSRCSISSKTVTQQ